MRIVALSLLLASSSVAGTVTLTMDEAPTQLIDGLVVSKGGLNFTFANAARTLFYNSLGPGIVTYVQDPSIQGSTSNQFSVAFSMPVSSIQFGMARLNILGQLATVDLFNASAVPFSTIVLNATLVDPFAEGLFSFSGGPVTNIRITPNATVSALAFDNLTVVTADVPEPSYLLVITAVVLTAVKRRR